MRDKLPKVIAAAIIGEDMKVYSIPQPGRHHDVIHYLAREVKHSIPIKGEQGFLLSDGTFGNRQFSKWCAIENEQLLPRAQNGRELFSECVWEGCWKGTYDEVSVTNIHGN